MIGDADRALADLDEVLRLTPVRSALPARLAAPVQAAVWARHRGIHACAREDAVESGCLLGRALAHHSSGAFRQVIHDCDEVLKLDPQWAAAYQLRGAAHAHLRAY